jgi:hypothetical protein
MQKRVSDLPPLLAPGVHPMTVDGLIEIGQTPFPLSQTRPEIIKGFKRMLDDLYRLAIPCTLIVDGSFLTEEIDPLDLDFTVCVSPEYYDACEGEQLAYLDWIRDSKEIKKTHLCDSYLCVDFPQDHPDWFDGIITREYWVNLYSVSKVHKRVRGVGAIEITGTP